MAELIVEIHVPLTPTPGLDKGEYQYPWIDDIEEHLAQLDGSAVGSSTMVRKLAMSTSSSWLEQRKSS